MLIFLQLVCSYSYSHDQFYLFMQHNTYMVRKILFCGCQWQQRGDIVRSMLIHQGTLRVGILWGCVCVCVRVGILWVCLCVCACVRVGILWVCLCVCACVRVGILWVWVCVCVCVCACPWCMLPRDKAAAREGSEKAAWDILYVIQSWMQCLILVIW